MSEIEECSEYQMDRDDLFFREMERFLLACTHGIDVSLHFAVSFLTPYLSLPVS